MRIVTQWLLDQGVDIVEQLRLPLFALAFGALTFALWLNRSQPGLLLAMIGVAFNGIAIALNGGAMPVYAPALEIAGMTEAELSPTFHILLPSELGAEFLLRGGPLGDVLPLAIPYLENVISLGDVLLAAGVAWFLFSAIARGSSDPDAGVVTLWNDRPQVDKRAEAWMIDREPRRHERQACRHGRLRPGYQTGRRARWLDSSRGSHTEPWRPHSRTPIRPPGSRRSLLVVLAGGHDQHVWRPPPPVAIAVMVLALTGSAMQTGLVFLAATLPNLFLGPSPAPSSIAGTRSA